ncbi:uncharacterized protein LOC117112366 isoform X1 [Anneissia japonica]|uniref:uncharacterized protein LOC117112366 isoform X1 n=1 Tax=Anneissia japonica TaxID=1529436 RepID=UPI0014256930|nr:uncharacterized protein LOC117112366 isoform X1 [Anneissia japonica]XP_033111334.1 uncharacterized protein LOC117112366 isoform X1 [Anneissia japonica]
MLPTLQKRGREKSVSHDNTRESTTQFMTYEIRKKIVDNLANKSSGPRDITCIWDYAGQMTYYITHRIFLTDRSSYGVVFSLCDDLEEFAKPRNIHKGHFEMTNLQMIIFWIRSIYEHTVLLHGTDEKPLIIGKIASPPISLIGTHKDLLPGSDAEKQALIDAKFRRIFKEIEDTPFESHVDRHMYAVANNAKMDEGIERLKSNVGAYMKAMAKTVPLTWVDFQTKVQEAGKTTMRMSLNKVTKIAVECGIKEENLIYVLNYLNDLGVILYSPTNKKLENTVITNIHMLIGVFMKIITDVEPGDADKVPVMAKFWRKLDKEGILPEPLVRYLWKNELTASEDEDDDVIFEDFIELMKAFGLLFEKNASEEDGRLFVVPSRMKTKPDERLEIKKDDEKTVSIYVTPKDFLPDAVYDILVVRFVNLSQDRGCFDGPKLLFQNKSEIGFDDNHYLRLGRIFIDSKQCLKLEISRMKEREADGADKPARKPHPDICKEVLNVLKKHLDEVYPSKRVVGYVLNILCLVCSTPGKPHFQELEKCLKNKNMTCDKTGERIAMSTANVQNLFVADSPVDNKRKISDSDQLVVKKLKTCDKTDKEIEYAEGGSVVHPVQSTELMTSDKTGQQVTMETDDVHNKCAEALSDFNVLKAIVSSWYDNLQSLPMLKVLFKDKVENEEQSKVTDTMGLLNILSARGDLSPQNLGLLCDTISVTKQFGVLSKIKQKLPSFPDVEEETISKTFTSHRQKLMKFGMVLTPADVKQIDGLYNTPRKDYADVWSMITDLENRLIISEGNMKEFIDSLEIVNLSLAINALTP